MEVDLVWPPTRASHQSKQKLVWKSMRSRNTFYSQPDRRPKFNSPKGLAFCCCYLCVICQFTQIFWEKNRKEKKNPNPDEEKAAKKWTFLRRLCSVFSCGSGSRFIFMVHDCARHPWTCHRISEWQKDGEPLKAASSQEPSASRQDIMFPYFVWPLAPIFSILFNTNTEYKIQIQKLWAKVVDLA